MNYTHHELERISYITGNGQSSLYRELEDKEAIESAAQSASSRIDEAKTAYPNEDFLEEVIYYCRNIEGRVTKAHIANIIEQLEELQLRVFNSTEYGLDELTKAQMELP